MKLQKCLQLYETNNERQVSAKQASYLNLQRMTMAVVRDTSEVL